jgi:hypothetical protein
MTGGIGRFGVVAVLSAVAVLGGGVTRSAAEAAPGVSGPAAGPTSAAGPAAGSVLQTGEFYVFPEEGPQFGNFRFVGRGDGQSTNWSLDADLDSAPVSDCLGVTGQRIDMVGLMKRDGHGAFGGHVTLVRLFEIMPTDQQAAGVRDLTGDQLLGCLRLVRPDLPAGAAFTLLDRLDHFEPAGVGAADGTFDLVTFTGNFGYLVTQYVPGRGWQPAASIGGSGLEPSVVRQRDGSLRIFVVGGGSHLYSAVISRDRRFSGWRNLGGGLRNAPTPVLNLDGSVSAYVIGNDHQLYQGLIAASGLFKGWIPLGKPPVFSGLLPIVLDDHVAAVGTGGGRVTVVATNAFDVVTRSYATGHWGPWQLLPWQSDGAEVYQHGLTGVSPAPGQMLLAWTPDAPVHVNTLVNGRWGRLTNLGGSVSRIFASQIGARTDLWADGFNNAMYQRTATSGHWGPWIKLPLGG